MLLTRRPLPPIPPDDIFDAQFCSRDHQVCFCPIRHRVLNLVAAPVWPLLPGRVQGWFLGNPCWLNDPDGAIPSHWRLPGDRR